MKEWKKYGNNWIEIAKVLSTQKLIQIKKHAECHFKQNLETNAPAVQQYKESLSPNKKGKFLFNDAAAHQNIDSLPSLTTKPKF
jgi:hypothetical protein